MGKVSYHKGSAPVNTKKMSVVSTTLNKEEKLPSREEIKQMTKQFAETIKVNPIWKELKAGRKESLLTDKYLTNTRTCDDPSDRETGEKVHVRGNCAPIHQEEGRIMMMSSNRTNNGTPNGEEESTCLSPVIDIPIDRMALGQMITQQLSSNPSPEAARSGRNGSNRCRDSNKSVFPVPNNGLKHINVTIFIIDD